MDRRFILYLLCFFYMTALLGHEGHHKTIKKSETKQETVNPSSEVQSTVTDSGGRPLGWTEWIGSFHLIFLHFPIALIVMTGISELLFAWRRRPLFDSASLFMIFAAATLAIPTAFLGLLYSYTETYSGLLYRFHCWHMWTGFSTAIFAIFVAVIRKQLGTSKTYYASLFILFLLVSITGYLGGGMTFGPYHTYTPSSSNIPN